MKCVSFSIDYFRDIPMDSQTTDITHFAVVFHYDVTTKALKHYEAQLITYDVIMKNNGKVRMSLAYKINSNT